MLDGLDFIGITRSIDQAIYMLLNAVATMLWRLDSALIGMSVYGYSTQDWLTGSGGGVWWILDWLIVNPGLFGINTWTLFAGLALMLWGLSRIARPFFNTSPVHPGKLLLFFILSYIVIDQGSTLMQDIEQWRMEAGNAMYTEITAGGDTSGITVPTIPSTSDPLGTAADLDGTSPIRGWEAVATSYFLVSSIDELHQAYPPQNFRIAYCLYNPEVPISGQNVMNAEGCSPRVAWDEWETVDVQMLEELLGFDIDSLTDPIEEFFDWFGITLEIGDNIDTIPVLQHHPENRELAIRQSAAGISRLTLGIIVALFPMIEANISLMLALAASFVYLSLPVVILFGFFLPTEAMVNKLLMQFVNVILRTLVIHGIVAVFMLILMDSALSGTLMSYLGLVGVGLVGGWWMMRLATATMKESMNQSMNAVGSVWMGSSTGLLGQSAGNAAATAMGAAKFVGAGALLAGAGAMNLLDIGEASYEAARSGEKDLRRGASGAMSSLDKQLGQMPPALARLAQNGNAVPNGSQKRVKDDALLPDKMVSMPLAMAGVAGSEVEPAGAGMSTNNRQGSANARSTAPLWGAGMASAVAFGEIAGNGRRRDLDNWIERSYEAQQSQRGQKQVGQAGRDLVGEELAWKAERAMLRRSPAETKAALEAARQTAEEMGHDRMVRGGRITPEGLRAVRSKLDPETAGAFQGKEGLWDLATLSAMGVQEQVAASPDEFRQAMSRAKSGWDKESPGHQVPQALGMDPVAAGPYYTAMNRFARLSDEAGLTEKQREQLLAEAQRGKVSADLKSEIETSLLAQQKQGRASTLTTDDIVDSATAMPPTLSGPERIWTTLAGQPKNGAAVGGTVAANTQTEKKADKELNDAARSHQDAQNKASKPQPQATTAGGQTQKAKGQKQPQKRVAAPTTQPAADAQRTAFAPASKASPQAGASRAAVGVAAGGPATASTQTGKNLGEELKSSTRSNQGVSEEGASASGSISAPATLDQGASSGPVSTPATLGDSASGGGPVSTPATLGDAVPSPPQPAVSSQSESSDSAPATGTAPTGSQTPSPAQPVLSQPASGDSGSIAGAAPVGGGQAPPAMSNIADEGSPVGQSNLGQALRPATQQNPTPGDQTPSPAQPSASQPISNDPGPVGGQAPQAQPAPTQPVSSEPAPMGDQTPPPAQPSASQPVSSGPAPVSGQTPPPSQPVNSAPTSMGEQTPPSIQPAPTQPINSSPVPVGGQTPPSQPVPTQPISSGPAPVGGQTPSSAQPAPSRPATREPTPMGGQTPPSQPMPSQPASGSKPAAGKQAGSQQKTQKNRGNRKSRKKQVSKTGG